MWILGLKGLMLTLITCHNFDLLLTIISVQFLLLPVVGKDIFYIYCWIICDYTLPLGMVSEFVRS